MPTNDDKAECSECLGGGKLDYECGDCGHWSEGECDVCNGTGLVPDAEEGTD